MDLPMKISVITVTKNSACTIERTVRSVLLQRDVEVEHIIKDAGSDDRTVDIAQTTNPAAIMFIQTDTGIYDAMNQGYAYSTGEIVAFLNSDDYYIDRNVLFDVIQAFNSSGCDFVYGDITMSSLSGEIVREWRTGEIGTMGLVGQQIPHPGIFIKRQILDQLAIPFDPSYRISADLKQQLLIINKFKFRGHYLKRPLVLMETGGESTKSLFSYILGWKESIRAYNEVLGSGGIFFVCRKVISKLNGVRLKALISQFGK
jgi:glycosyltransferase involved in cell wall biosynthesis